MMIIGVDYHPSFQAMAFLMEETGECGEQELHHSDGSGSLHAYPHADSSLLQLSIEFLCLSDKRSNRPCGFLVSDYACPTHQDLSYEDSFTFASAKNWC
jgi:hypothetical protein